MESALKKIVFIILLVLPAVVSAEAPVIEVSPLIIEEEAKIRDILDYDIKVRNNAKPYKVGLYPIVVDIAKDGEQGVAGFSESTDKEATLSRWMSFSRGVIDLMPGEEKTLSVKINVNPNAAPGKYRAILMLSEGPNRYEAEALAKVSPQPQAIFNITVKENAVYKAEISSFRPARETFIELPARIILELKNIGNKPIVPEGAIYIYNRRGNEVGKLDFNADRREIISEQTQDFSQEWSMPKAFGRYKARLEAEYGNGDKKDLQDTVYFWVLPWMVLAAFGAGSAVLFILLIIMNFRRRHVARRNAAANPGIATETEMEQAGVLNLRRK